MTRAVAQMSIAFACLAAFLYIQPAMAADSTCQTGAGLFDYGPHRDNVEAEMLAMDLTGELRAPADVYDRILRDLGLIRQMFPFLEQELDHPDWVPRKLAVGLDSGDPSPEYQSLNTFYQVTDERLIVQSANVWLIEFCDNLNAVAVALEYEAVPGVRYAHPDGYGGCLDLITVHVVGQIYQYHFENGYTDDLLGCSCHRIWDIDVELDGTVLLQSYEEDPPSCPEFIQDPTCCFPEGACSIVPMASCLSTGGQPQTVGAPCETCRRPIPASSCWGVVIIAMLLLIAGTVISRYGSQSATSAS